VPTYQYACTECDHSFEQFQNFSDDALTVCPQCEGRLRKVFNAVGVVFKGSGFYRNDSRSADAKATSDGKAAKAGESGSGATGGDKTSSGSSTEKVAATSESSAKTSTPKDSPSAA